MWFCVLVQRLIQKSILELEIQAISFIKNDQNRTRFFFAALNCEAKPVIQHYKLQKLSNIKPFAVFQRDHIHLTVSGIGSNAMAAATAFTLALFAKSEYPVLLNLGIAGHTNAPLHSVYLVNKIIDAASSKTFYPQLIFDVPCTTLPLLTVAKAEQNYPADCLYDMEAAAFYETAIRFSSIELIHSIKIVSDNKISSIDQINATQLSLAITEKMEIVENVCNQLVSVASTIQLEEPDLYAEILQNWHFSVSGKQQLRQLLWRWQVLSNEPPELQREHIQSAKQLIQSLETQLDALDFTL